MRIYPVAETNGEGNGWYDVPENEATMWTVEDDVELLDAFYTRSEAEAYLDAASSH